MCASLGYNATEIKADLDKVYEESIELLSDGCNYSRTSMARTSGTMEIRSRHG